MNEIALFLKKLYLLLITMIKLNQYILIDLIHCLLNVMNT